VPQVVVGLGNPGPEYRETRHNVGQAVLDRLASRLGVRFRIRGPAALAETEWQGARVYLAKPIAFMNVAGPSVARLLRLLALDPTALILVYDDLDLPFGRIRIRHKGRHGGHNGVRSVLDTLGTDAVRRVKVGVGRPTARDEVVDWVLSGFTPEEREALPAILDRAADAALELVTG
jgi:PTH1 family peptidyl-tRNA hydrolase